MEERQGSCNNFSAYTNADVFDKVTCMSDSEKIQKCVNSMLSDKLLGTSNELCKISYDIGVIRGSKLYTVSIIIRRIFDQLLFGSKKEKLDFCYWVCHNIMRMLCPNKKSKNTGRPLVEFDYLQEVNKTIDEIALSTKVSADLVNNPGNTIYKTGRQFFIFASVPYYDIGGGQRFAQIAKVLDDMGYCVYYFYGFESSESKKHNMYIPALKHDHIDKYSIESFARDLGKDDVLILEYPSKKVIPFLEYAKKNGNPILYEHVDNWDSSLGNLFFDKISFHKIITEADYITVTARVLGEKIEEEGRSDYFYCPNAVDSSLFEPSKKYECPKDLVIGKKTLLYFGSLWGEWFDWDLITHVAQKCDCTINLIGDYHPISNKIKELPSNIHFLGLKKHEELPAYLQYSDITLLPFKNSVIGKYVSPLKIFEYIAMNKPVLATPLNDIMEYPNVILSDDKNVWEDTVNKGITSIDATIFTAENSWYARCNQILDIVGRKNRKIPKVSIIVLNYNNMKVIFRCVDSLLKFSGAYDAEIIVVDNGSTDGSYEKLVREYGTKIVTIKNNKNGCACGRNLGVKASSGEYLFFLDSDQWIVGDHYLDAALEILDNNDLIGAVSWGAGWFDEGSVGGPIVDYLANRGVRSPLEMGRTDIAYLATSGMLMKKYVFEETGGFDEYYDPTCYEDTDLALMIRHLGYELAYCSHMPIMHIPHQTTKSGSSEHTNLMKRNGTYFTEKWKARNPRLLAYHLK